MTGGAEMRALSAVDLALWDLLGKSLNVPVYRLLGGKSNPEIRLYNTCFGHRYDFNKEPEKIMHELIDHYGIKAIKIWPFDRAALRNQHEYVTTADIEEGLAPVRKLRDTFGNDIEILMEFHSCWDLTSAVRIARALEPYRPMWLEDMLLPGNFSQYKVLAESTSNPLTISERMAGRMEFLQMLEARAAKYVMFDVTWCGGLSEARKISTMAEAFELPVAPHTAGGPLLFYASPISPRRSPTSPSRKVARSSMRPHGPPCWKIPSFLTTGRSALRNCRVWGCRSSPRCGRIPRPLHAPPPLRSKPASAMNFHAGGNPSPLL